MSSDEIPLDFLAEELTKRTPSRTLFILGDGVTIGKDGLLHPSFASAIAQQTANDVEVVAISHFTRRTLARRSNNQLIDWSAFRTCIGRLASTEDAGALDSVTQQEFAKRDNKPILDGGRLLLFVPKDDPEYRNERQLLMKATTRLNDEAGKQGWICASYHYGHAIEYADQIGMQGAIKGHIDGLITRLNITRDKFFSHALIIYADGGLGFGLTESMYEVRGYQYSKPSRGCFPQTPTVRRVGYTILNTELGGTYSTDPSVASADELMTWLMGTPNIERS